MLKNFIRLIITIAGIGFGPGIVLLVYEMIRRLGGPDPSTTLLPWFNLLIFILSGIISGIIFFFISKGIINWFEKLSGALDETLSKLPGRVVLAGSIGLILGLLVAFLLSWLVNFIPIMWISLPINVILYILCGYMGIKLGMRLADFAKIPRFQRSSKQDKDKEPANPGHALWFAPKILDTSVIIDGRIFDICKTGIMEGTIVIPEFVLSELRHIADSADSLKRSKGRRGLDILNKIQRELDIPVEITDIDYEDMEVDAKLLRLAKESDGKVITNDFNLNKVAAVQGVPVFNINELSNAVKPVLLPGEELTVTVIKEGKEAGQGIAYLDDGTMIVVEGGRNKIGETLQVVVTSVLQTSAGRMIFVKIKD